MVRRVATLAAFLYLCCSLFITYLLHLALMAHRTISDRLAEYTLPFSLPHGRAWRMFALLAQFLFLVQLKPNFARAHSHLIDPSIFIG